MSKVSNGVNNLRVYYPQTKEEEQQLGFVVLPQQKIN